MWWVTGYIWSHLGFNILTIVIPPSPSVCVCCVRVKEAQSSSTISDESPGARWGEEGLVPSYVTPSLSPLLTGPRQTHVGDGEIRCGEGGDADSLSAAAQCRQLFTSQTVATSGGGGDTHHLKCDIPPPEVSLVSHMCCHVSSLSPVQSTPVSAQTGLRTPSRVVRDNNTLQTTLDLTLTQLTRGEESPLGAAWDLNVAQDNFCFAGCDLTAQR